MGAGPPKEALCWLKISGLLASLSWLPNNASAAEDGRINTLFGCNGSGLIVIFCLQNDPRLLTEERLSARSWKSGGLRLPPERGATACLQAMGPVPSTAVGTPLATPDNDYQSGLPIRLMTPSATSPASVAKTPDTSKLAPSSVVVSTSSSKGKNPLVQPAKSSQDRPTRVM